MEAGAWQQRGPLRHQRENLAQGVVQALSNLRVYHGVSIFFWGGRWSCSENELLLANGCERERERDRKSGLGYQKYQIKGLSMLKSLRLDGGFYHF